MSLSLLDQGWSGTIPVLVLFGQFHAEFESKEGGGGCDCIKKFLSFLSFTSTLIHIYNNRNSEVFFVINNMVSKMCFRKGALNHF